MTHRSWRSLLLRAVLVGLIVHGHEKVMAQAAQDGVKPSARSEPWPSLANSGSAFLFPPPISDKDVARYASVLDLSPGQRRYLEALHAGYVTQCGEIEQRFSRLILPWTSAMREMTKTPPVPQPAYADATAALLRAAQRFREEVNRADHGLFDDVQSVLAESQLPLLHRVQLHRERAKRIPHRRITISKARVDLSQFIEELNLGEYLLHDLDGVMWEYEQAVTPMMQRLDESLLDAAFKINELSLNAELDEHGNPWNKGDPKVREKVHADWYAGNIALMRTPVDLQKRIAMLNDEYLAKFLTRMPADAAERVQFSYLSYCYWRVYPDHADPELIYRRLRQAPELGRDLREALDAQWLQYRKEYDSICKQMCQETDRWQELGASTEQAREFSHDHNQTILTLCEARANKSEEFIRGVTAFLPPDVLKIYVSLINDWTKKLEEQRATFRRVAELDRLDFS